MSEKNPRRRVVVRWLGEHRTDVQVRGRHHLQGDETPEYGGHDTGPMPTELLLAAVGSCMCLAVAHVARKRRITHTQVEVEVGAEKDMQAFRFNDIYVKIKADLPPETLTPLVEQASHYCFVSNTIRQGCNIHYTSETIAGTTVQS